MLFLPVTVLQAITVNIDLQIFGCREKNKNKCAVLKKIKCRQQL